VRSIAALRVDASGADLSRLVIMDLAILDGVFWTQQTRWPASIADKVREKSDEIDYNKFRVRIGETPDRSSLSRV
jgi:hypothetical protein